MAKRRMIYDRERMTMAEVVAYVESLDEEEMAMFVAELTDVAGDGPKWPEFYSLLAEATGTELMAVAASAPAEGGRP
jgi:hypothetical protein